MTDPTPRPERVTLTDDEIREQFARLLNPAAFVRWAHDPGRVSQATAIKEAHRRADVLLASDAMVARDAAREAALRAQIKAESPVPHAYAVEVLVNPGSPHEYWRIWTDEQTYYADEEEAQNEANWMVEDGYRPDTVRVVAVTLAARIVGGDQA